MWPDPVSGVWLYGGQNIASASVTNTFLYNGTWVFTGTNLTQPGNSPGVRGALGKCSGLRAPLTVATGQPSSSVFPGGRWGAFGLATSTALWIYGGCGPYGTYGDL